MREEIDGIRKLVDRARRLSCQSSYARRLPDNESIAAYNESIVALVRYISVYPKDAEAWELLSVAQEGILEYHNAIDSLTQAMSISADRSRFRLKRMALLRENEKFWQDLGLSPIQLASLGNWLSVHQSEWDMPQSFAITRRWFEINRIESKEIIDNISQLSGGSDAQTYHNIADP